MLGEPEHGCDDDDDNGSRSLRTQAVPVMILCSSRLHLHFTLLATSTGGGSVIRPILQLWERRHRSIQLHVQGHRLELEIESMHFFHITNRDDVCRVSFVSADQLPVVLVLYIRGGFRRATPRVCTFGLGGHRHLSTCCVCAGTHKCQTARALRSLENVRGLAG